MTFLWINSLRGAVIPGLLPSESSDKQVFFLWFYTGSLYAEFMRNTGDIFEAFATHYKNMCILLQIFPVQSKCFTNIDISLKSILNVIPKFKKER